MKKEEAQMNGKTTAQKLSTIKRIANSQPQLTFKSELKQSTPIKAFKLEQSNHQPNTNHAK